MKDQLVFVNKPLLTAETQRNYLVKTTRGSLVYSPDVIPAKAASQSWLEISGLDPGCQLRSGRNDELVRPFP